MHLRKNRVLFLVIVATVLICLPVVCNAQPHRPVIVIEPGHGIANDAGQIDPGAVSGSLVEKDINLDVAKAARSALANCPVQVVLTREADDPAHTLNDIDELVNQMTPDVGVAIHVNSAGPTATGTESWHTVGGFDDQGSYRLGSLLASQIAAAFSIPNRGTKPETSNRHRGLYIHWWNAPSALVEIAFLQGDAEILANQRLEFGRQVAVAVVEYLGLSPSCVSAAGSQPSTGNTAKSSTVLLLDISGSMGDFWQGGVKMESAKNAATDVVTMMEQEAQAGGALHRVGVAAFSSWAEVPLAPSADYAQAKAVISELYPTAGTNIGEGLRVANEALAAEPSSAQHFIILLSDGMTNEGLGPSEILNGPVQDAAAAGTCIYTVGFGDPGDLDENLLRQIASASGCGEYYYASDAYQLGKIYIELRHRSLGQVVASVSGDVQQGQTTPPQPFDVPPQQGELNITLTWPGSTLDLVVTDPQGRTVDETYPGVSLVPYARFVYMIIQNPVAGAWTLSVFGREVPEGVINYDAVASVRAAPQPASQPVAPPLSRSKDGRALLVVTLTLSAALLVAIAAVALQTSRSGSPSAGRGAAVAYLQWSGGAPIPVRRNVFTIGRDPRNELVVNDGQVSRQHAQIRREPEGFVIYDLNSTNGTFVNGQRINRCLVRPGDQIRVGDTDLVFYR